MAKKNFIGTYGPIEKNVLRPDYVILIYQQGDCKMLADYLRLFGFVPIVSTKENLMAKIKALDYDLCILDYIDDSYSFKPLNYLRELTSDIPAIMLASQLPEITKNYAQKIKAFKAGVDDYIVRPYNLDELIYRIRAILRRCRRIRTIKGTYQLGDYKFDTQERLLYYQEMIMPLPPIQSLMLNIMCAYKNSYIPKAVYLFEIWGDISETQAGLTQSLRAHICMIRNLLRFDSRIRIDTVRDNVGLFIKEDIENDSLF